MKKLWPLFFWAVFFPAVVLADQKCEDVWRYDIGDWKTAISPRAKLLEKISEEKKKIPAASAVSRLIDSPREILKIYVGKKEKLIAEKNAALIKEDEEKRKKETAESTSRIVLAASYAPRKHCSHGGKPQKSETKGKHRDEDCCPDPDEWPDPECAYSASDYEIMLKNPKVK